MAFRPQPDSFYWSDRIDYDAVSERMLELSQLCAGAQDIPAFMAIVQPTYRSILTSYLHLLRDYREGELATLMAHLEDCVNALMPEHLPFVAISREKLYFIPKAHIVRDES